MWLIETLNYLLDAVLWRFVSFQLEVRVHSDLVSKSHVLDVLHTVLDFIER